MTLPKFLLAWSDFNWLWLYARLRPAPAGRWTVLRTLALTALLAAAGAGFGLALALLTFQQPVGWLPWLLGLWGGCIGVCWFGVTAICWNQRAARLRANPALPAALPRSRFRFGRWCLGLLYLTLLGGITPLALLVTMENLRGEIAWRREHARLVAAGEKLTFREILGPEIPPEENAVAAPVFAPFIEAHERREQMAAPASAAGEVGDEKLVWPPRHPLETVSWARELVSYEPETTNNTWGRLENIPVWSQAVRSLVAAPRPLHRQWAASISLPPPGDPALDVLAALELANPALDEICAAATRPRARFPQPLESSLDTLPHHLPGMKVIQLVLQLRGVARLAAGQTDVAFADALASLDVAELLREEPLLISQLVRYANHSIALSLINEGLRAHRWSDAQLATFQERFAQLNFWSGLALALEGERAWSIASMEQLLQNPALLSANPEQAQTPHLLWQPQSRAVLRQNQVSMVRLHSRNLVSLRRLLARPPEQGWIEVLREWEPNDSDRTGPTFSPYRIFADMTAKAFQSASRHAARKQVTATLAIVACGLERYHLSHGVFPERLDQLAPFCPGGVPLDPMVNQPFRYQRTDDGWFLLYSVGPNGTDDGGVMRSTESKDAEDLDWPWPVPTRPAKVRLF
ncbi:MAG: hypothetical protein ACK45B_02320 [Limisphaerales bacterium]